MGLIKNSINAVGETTGGLFESAGGALLSGAAGVLHQAMFKEYYASGDMSGDIIMKRAEQIRGKGSTNKNSDANVITNGSLIDVQHNQCMIIVENGKVIEACMEPGQFTYRNDLAPSFFAGEGTFSEKAKSIAMEMWQQIQMGGQRRSTQRVYFINMGILDEPFQWGIGNIPFRHSSVLADNMPPIRINMILKANGMAKIRIVDPLAFYMQKGAQKAGGDNNGIYTLEELQDTLFAPAKSKIRQAIATAIAELGRSANVAYSDIMIGENAIRIEQMVNQSMTGTELGQCGFNFSQFSVNGGFAPRDEDIQKLTDMEMKLGERMFTASDAGLAQYDVMKDAANNQGGAGTGFMGLGMMGFGMNQMNGIGGMMGMQNAPAAANTPNQFINNPQQPMNQTPKTENTWICSCGSTVSGKFCTECGSPKPVTTQSQGWTCVCGTLNQGKFCSECGNKKPANEPLYRCDKCGWVPSDPKNPPKFCPECGDVFDDNDCQ